MKKSDVVDLENTTLKTLTNMEVENRVENSQRKREKWVKKKRKKQYKHVHAFRDRLPPG